MPGLGWHFRQVLAGKEADALARIEEPGLAAHQRLGEEGRILEHADDGEIVAVHGPVLGEPGLGAAGDAVAPQVVGLQVRGR